MTEVVIVGGPPRFALEEIQRVVARACEREGARRALLFGSYARGEADALSDVDLLIECESDLPFVERFVRFRDVLQALPGADILVYTPAELAEVRQRSGFVERAEREGIVLYEQA